MGYAKEPGDEGLRPSLPAPLPERTTTPGDWIAQALHERRASDRQHIARLLDRLFGPDPRQARQEAGETTR